MANANAGYTVNMRFNADVSRAKQQIMDLETSLRKVANVNISNVGGAGLHLTKDLQSASLAATQLAQTLNKTMNMNTGKLDLTLFNRELQKSGMTLQKYQQALSKAGPAGQQAFMQLTQSITLADMKTMHLSDRIMKLGHTLGNTLRWQISTTILNGMINSVSTAYRYTKDLNESLNEIRIVTGYNVAQMDKFADKANKAAKALATTTNEYAKASLIYFQQGLSDEEVEKRTNLTIKMANVTGKSAQEVSDQLTAIWNNFYDGTESLEHYIDVITALGAATASSSEEISQGLNKFAAVAETVGLSYEYAASALATVTATTRESADVVGNAFKTLFARIQGLQLGETLDDGTTLNKYSTALAKVGIDIQTASGEMKDMDTILNEMGAKWETLSQAQQTALAQTVGGVRQYTHLVSLMENWDYFKENLSISMASDGTLDKQAKIYEESWEAARDKVTAALEDIYKKLLDDDAFIGILNFFEKFLNGVSGLIDGLGGLHGVLLLISSALTTIMQKQVAGAMASAAYFVRDLTPKGRAKAEETRKEANQLMVDSYTKSGTPGGAYAAKSAGTLGEINDTYLKQSGKLSETQKAVYDLIVQQKQGLAEAAIKQAELADEAERHLQTVIKTSSVGGGTAAISDQGKADLDTVFGPGASNSYLTQRGAGIALTEKYRKVTGSAHTAATLQGYFGKDSDQFKALYDAQMPTGKQALDTNIDSRIEQINEIQNRLKNLGITSTQVDKELADMLGPDEAKHMQQYAAEVDNAEKQLKELKAAQEEYTAAKAEADALGKTTKRFTDANERRKTAKRNVFGGNLPNNKGRVTGALEKVSKQDAVISADIAKNATAAVDAKKAMASAAGMSEKAIGKVVTTTEKSNEAFSKMVIKTGEVKQGLEDMKRSGQQLEGMDPTVKMTTGLTALGSVLSTTSMAISSMIGLFKVLNNEDMSFGDRLLSAFTTLSMVIPMLIQSFSALNVQQIAGFSAGLAHALGLKATEKAAQAAAAGTATFGATLYTVLWPIGLVIAAVTILVGLFTLLSKAFEKEETAAEKAAKAVADQEETVATLNKRLAETHSELEEIIDLLEEYKKLDDVFDGLVEGSIEWITNLQEQNKVIQELINKYPELIEMGAVGFKDGIYQVLDEQLLTQYTQGVATVKMLSAQVGVLGAQYNAAMLNAELERIQNESKLLWDKANYTNSHRSVESTNKTNLSDRNFEISSMIGGKQFTHTYQDSTESGIYVNADSETARAHFNSLLDIMASDVSNAMYNNKKTAEEAAKSIIEKDGGYNYSNDVLKQMVYDVADHLYYAQSTYLEELEAIQQNELLTKRRLLLEFEAKWQMQAQSILMSQQGYSSLNNFQRQAASIITANQLQNASGQYDYGVIAQGRELSTDFVERLAKGLGYKDDYWIEWRNIFGQSEGKNDVYNDAGDFFKKTDFGAKLMDRYLLEVRGVQGGLEAQGNIGRDSYKVTYGDGEEVSYAEVLDYFTSQLEYGAVDYQQIMSSVQQYSDMTLAALAGDVSSLTEKQLLLSGLASKDEQGNYTLNTDSVSYKNAEILAGFDEYDASNTELSETEWQEQKTQWYNQLVNSVQNYNAALAETKKIQADTAAGNALIAQAAEAYELDAEVVEAYARSLHTLYEETNISYEAISKMAIANARMSKGIEDLQDGWEEASAALERYGKDSYEYFEALNQVSAALKEIFGVDVSAKFIEENKEKIETMLQGGEEAVRMFEELELAAAKDFVINLDIDSTYKTQLQQMLEDISQYEKQAEFGVGFTGSIDPSYIQSLNEMLKAGSLTVEQVQQMFNGIGWDPNIKYDDVETTSEVVNQIFTGNQQDVMSGGGDETWERIVTHSITQIPKIGDKVTAIPKAPSSVASTTPSKKSGGQGKDRFHYVEKSLQEAERQYDNIAKARERAFGADKLALYDKEIEKASNVKDALQAYADEAERIYKNDRKALLGSYEVQLDSAGNIINYDEMMEKYGNDERFTDLVANYEESLGAWKDQLQGVIDKNNEILDLSLEKIQYKIDMSVKVDSQSQEYLDFLMEMADDPLTDAAFKLGLLTKKIQSSTTAAEELGAALSESLTMTGWSNEEINTLLSPAATEDTITSLLKTNKLTDTQVSMLESYRDQLYETTRMMMTWTEDIKDTVVEAFDKMGEAFDQSANQLEHYNTVLTTYENIIDMVGKDTLGITNEMMSQLSRDQVDNAMASLNVAKSAHDTNVKALEQLRNSYNKNWSDDAKKAWNEAIEHAEEAVRESEQNMFQSWENALQSAAEAFEKAVETAITAYETAMSGLYKSFDAMQTAYDQQSTLNERYVADYEKIYELSKLNRQVTKSIDESTNVKAKRELAVLQKEILTLSQNDAKVSKYQIEYLQKQYDLKLAQIALEEAQTAKSQVRMQKDSEGNWSYIYTANEAQVDNAQQNYEDKLFALQTFNQKSIQEQSNALIQLQQDFSNAMANIKREDYNTEEEYVNALNNVQTYYQSMIDYRLEQMNLMTTNSKILYEDDWQKYNEITGYKISKDHEWVSSFEQTQIAIVGNYTSISDYQNSFKTSSEQLILALTKAYQTWQSDVDIAMEKAGTSTKDFADDMSKHSEEVRTETEQILYSLEDLEQKASNAFSNVVTSAKNNFTQYSTTIDQYINKNKQLLASLNAIITAKTKVSQTGVMSPTGEDVDLKGTGTTTTTTAGGTTSYIPPAAKQRSSSKDDVDYIVENGIVKPKKEKIEDYSIGSHVLLTVDEDSKLALFYKKKGKFVKSKSGGTNFIEDVPNFNAKYGVSEIIGQEGGYYQIRSHRKSGSTDYVKSDGETFWAEPWQLYPVGFDTGGYTGSWDPSGRLALLHQKEIVLNADDTVNFLNAIEIVRDIARVIDLNAASQANAFNMIAATSSQGSQILEQQVTIHAEFPNATNRTEIEAAFDNLVNKASQFANRKNK